MITERQEKLLDFLVREYICTAEPVSSKALKKAADLDVCGATVRNDLQALTKQGYIQQPHTSAGRVPTRKAYQLFAEKLEKERAVAMHNFIVRQINEVQHEMEQNMKEMQGLMQTLEHGDTFDVLNILDSWHKKMFDKFEI